MGNAEAVWGIGAAESARHWQRLRQSAIQTDRPEPKVWLRRADPPRREKHATTIGCPAAHSVRTGMIGQPLSVATCGRHHVHVGVPGNGGAESDLGSVGREVRINLGSLSRGEAACVSAAPRDDPQVAGVCESHQIAAHGRVTKQSRLLCEGSGRDGKT